MNDKKWPQERVSDCDVVFEEKEFSIIFEQTTLAPVILEPNERPRLAKSPVFTAYMTPLHARDLVKSLEAQLKSYETQFGKILNMTEVSKISKENSSLQESNKRMKNRENMLLYTIPAGCAGGMIILGIMLKWALF